VTSPDELGGKIRLGHLANNGKFNMAALEPSLPHERGVLRFRIAGKEENVQWQGYMGAQ